MIGIQRNLSKKHLMINHSVADLRIMSSEKIIITIQEDTTSDFTKAYRFFCNKKNFNHKFVRSINYQISKSGIKSLTDNQKDGMIEFYKNMMKFKNKVGPMSMRTINKVMSDLKIN